MIVGLIESIGLLSGILFILGFILVIVEIFVPGFGIPGIAGFIMLALGIIVTADTILEAVILIILLLLILGVIISIVLRSVNKGKLGKTLVLSTSMKKENGYISNDDMNYFLGKTGITLTILRPSGTIDLDGVKIDVVSQGEYIERGTEVKITKVEGRKIVVKKLNQ